MPKPFNWTTPCAFDDAQKGAFHRRAKKQLKALAALLRWSPRSFDLRSNPAGPAVSGEITLHGDRVYVQVSQGPLGILIRSCKGRKDFVGGPNSFAPLDLLDDLPALRERIGRALLQREAA